MSADGRSDPAQDAARLRTAAEAWLAEDPDPATRDELASLLAAGDDAGLAERFGSRLQFGTAGLRGEMGPGPNRMNVAVVRRAAAGLGSWLLDLHSDRIGDGVAICFDARHHSREFAEDTARVLAAQGITAHLLAGPLPTPVLAYAVKKLEAGAGVMVTASHNPARDNGYKVYDATGAQIVPPVDGQISAAIDAVGPLATVELAPLDHPLVDRVGDELVESYLDDVLAMLPSVPSGPPLSIVYSAMHGVGGRTVVALLERAGFGAPTLVDEQFAPDPDFPTVAFPNPEEPGAIDLTLARARAVGAELALVNDPDADRLAVAVPDPLLDPAGPGGGWRMLRGDEVGVLLADAVLADPPVPAAGGADLVPVLACSIVSSQQLGRMAAAAGIAFEETLTGFKWIARSPGPGRRLLFGYEEALGYCVGDLVADKDGISALLAVVRRAVALRATGTTLLDRLDELSRIHGLHATRQLSFRAEGLAGLKQIATAMGRLRTDAPTELAGRPVERIDDLASPPPGSPFPPSNVLIFRMADARVIVRPSGTEPKLKAYIEVISSVAPGPDGLADARAAADAALDALAAVVTTTLALS